VSLAQKSFAESMRTLAADRADPQTYNAGKAFEWILAERLAR
jgi:hypothetical protein